jgi:ribosomal protein L28
MAKICPITKRGSLMGGGYSNRTRATKFNPTGKVRKYPNLQKKKVYVPELKKYLEGNLNLQEATQKAKQNTRNYAKRQLTWFRNQTPGWKRV